MLVIHVIVMPLFHKWTHLAWQNSIVVHTVHRWIKPLVIVSSPLVCCILTSSNVESGHQGIGYQVISSLSLNNIAKVFGIFTLVS